MFQDPIILEGKVVRLEPLEDKHLDALVAIAKLSPEEFRYTSTPINEAQKQSYFSYAFANKAAGTTYPWVMLDTSNNDCVGTTRLYDANWSYKHCTLGYSWFHTRLFGTAFNVESKYLMLKYAFEDLGLIRVQMNSDSRNARSQKAIKGLGATYEGTLRSSQVNKDGFVRDNAIYSIIDSEWPRVKENLEKRIARRLSPIA